MADGETCPPPQNLELYVSLDSTWSFKDLLPHAGEFIPKFMDALSAKVPNLKAGLGYFGDKPVDASVYGSAGGPADKCFTQIIPITTDLASVKAKSEDLSVQYQGGDLPEDSISAMGYEVGSAAGYSLPKDGDDTFRVILILTDAEGKEGTPDNYAPDPGEKIPCKERAPFALASDVLALLHDRRVFPIFLVDEGILEWWEHKVFDEWKLKDSSLVRAFELNGDASVLADKLLDVVVDSTCMPQVDPVVDCCTMC